MKVAHLKYDKSEEGERVIVFKPTISARILGTDIVVFESDFEDETRWKK